MNETWMPIAGYEGLYEISNLGHVRNSRGLVKKHSLDKDGYPRIGLIKDKQQKTFTIHRLVATAFCYNPNPEKYNQVNHKDENKQNNNADNLEWCDNEYNHAYGTCGKRAGEKNSKKVGAFVLTTGEIEHYESLTAAAEALGVNNCHISSAAKGKRPVAHGRVWMYE